MANTKKYVSLDKLGLYDEKIKGVIATGDEAALDAAKAYADSLASNYEAAGSVNTAKTELEGKITAEETRATAEEARIAGLVKTAQDEVDALELVVDTKAAQADLTALANKVGEVPTDKTVMGIIGEIQSGNATDNAALQAQIDALSSNKADKTQVATDIADAVKAEEDARKEAVKGVQDAVDALAGTHATDKKDLADAIALKADQTALDEVAAIANAAATKVALEEEVNRAKGEEARIEGLVTAEAAKAREEEGKLDARLVEVETFFKTAEGETIDQAMDTLVEIQKYITEDGAAADEMVKDIAANAKAIADHVATDHDFAGADAALKSELMGEINKKADKTTVEGIDGRVEVVEGKVEVLEGEMDDAEGRLDDVEAAVATKAEQSALESAVAALEGADTGLGNRITALENKFGGAEGSVEDMIADAKQEAIDTAASAADAKDEVILAAAKKYADDEDAKIEERVGALETASATHASASDLTALAGRVTAEEGKVATLQGEMTAVQALAAANKAAHEANAAAIATKASQEDLNKVSGRVTALETWHNNFTEVSEA